MKRRTCMLSALSTLCLASLSSGCFEADGREFGDDAGFDTDGTDGEPEPGDTDEPGPETTGVDEPDPETTGDTDGEGSRCGDGMLEGDEVCDDGIADGAYGNCLADCSGMGPHCGDGMLDDTEGCDDGENSGEYGSCQSDCSMLAGWCGDGITEGPEACDDGNTEDGDTCSADCLVAGPVVWELTMDGGWQNSDEQVADLVWHPDGTLYTVFNELGFPASSRTHIVSADADGELIDDAIHDLSSTEQAVYAAAPRPSGGVVAVGTVEQPLGFVGSEVTLTSTMGTPSLDTHDAAVAWHDVAIDFSNGNRVMVGTTEDDQWIATYTGTQDHTLESWFPIHTVGVLANGDLVIAGNAANGSFIIARDETNFDVIGNYTHEAPDDTLWIVHDLEVGPDDTIYVVGEMHPMNQSSTTRAFVVAVSSALVMQWSHLELSNTGSVWRSVDVGDGGELVLGGNFEGIAPAARVRKLTTDGASVWTYDFDDETREVTAVALDDVGDVYAACRSTEDPTDGLADVKLSKIVP